MTFCGGTGVIVTSLDLIASVLRQDGAMALFRRNIEVIDTLGVPGFYSDRIYNRAWHARQHDDVIKWKHFPRYWPFGRGIHRSPVNSPHRDQ